MCPNTSKKSSNGQPSQDLIQTIFEKALQKPICMVRAQKNEAGQILMHCRNFTFGKLLPSVQFCDGLCGITYDTIFELASL